MSKGDRREREAVELYQRAGLLENLYHRKGMSAYEIAAMFDVSSRTIYNWMERHGIDRRKSKHDRPPTFVHSNPNGYELWHHQTRGEQYNVRLHRLLAVAEHGFDAVAGNDVHHRNGIPWDNRPENIEVLGHGEHARLHSPDRDRDWKGDFL